MRVRDLRFVRIVQRRRSASRPFRLARFAAIVVTLALATTAGVALLRPADAAGPGTGVLVYSDGVANSPWVRDWSGSTWSSPNSSAGIHQMRVLTGAASRTRNEMITVGTNLLFDIRGQMWNGSSWSQFSFGRLTQVTENDWWSQAVAYEGLSDQALLVWSNDTSSTTPVSYRTWNGSVWSAAGTVTAPFAGKARQMKLAASPDSDEMVLVVSDDSSRDYAVVWNGSSWGTAITLSAAGSGDDRTDISVAYEQQSGDALVVYGRGATSVYYRTWNGSTWSSEATYNAPGQANGNVRWTALGSDPGSDRIALGVTTFGGSTWLAVWQGDLFTHTQLATQNAPGTDFPSVAVAFESLSGHALALYGTGSTTVRYRTWEGSSWSQESSGFDMLDLPNSLTLDSDPFSDAIMATVQDDGSDLVAAQWSGTSWGGRTVLSTTGETRNQPWAFVWDKEDPPPAIIANAAYLDEFNAVSYTGSDGSIDWSSNPWFEVGTGDQDPASGPIIVQSSGWCATSDCLSIEGGPAAREITRTANLAGVSVAELTVDLRRVADTSCTTTLRVRSGPAQPWTTLGSFGPNGGNTSLLSLTYSIRDYASSTTEISFLMQSCTSGQFVYIDNVAISVDGAPENRFDSEGDAVSFTIPARDPYGDPLTFSATGLPAGITIGPATGVVSGTLSQTAAVGSPHTVVITVTDPRGNSDSESFVWTVAAVNVAPVVVDLGDQSGTGGDTVSLAWSASDPDADVLTWSAANLPPGLSIDPVSGLISGTIDYGSSIGSPYASTVRATDPGGLFDEVAFAWTVVDSNRAPDVTNPGDQSSVEGQTVTVTVVGSDPDGDTLTWTASGLPGGLSIAPGTGVISGNLAFDASDGSPYTVVVRATDDGIPSQFTEVQFSWTVTDTNRAPSVTSPGDLGNAEGDTVAIAVSGSDPDGDTLSWSATGLPSGLSIAPATGVISGVIGYDAGAGSPHTVTVRATDDGVPGLFGEATFTWSIGDTNRPPSIQVTLPDRTDPEGTSMDTPVPAVDPDGDPIAYSATGLPPGLGIHPSAGTIVGMIDYTAAAGSPYTVTVRVEDDSGLFDEATFTWTVTNVPVALQIEKASDAAGTVRPGDALGYTITVTNTSTLLHTNVTVTDPVPTGTTYFPGSVYVTRPLYAADNFESGNYTGSVGSLAWSGPWQETGDNGSSSSGLVAVEGPSSCQQSACLRFGGYGVNLNGVSVARSVNLSGAPSPRLTLRYRNSLLGSPGGSVAVQARGGGSGWVTLTTFNLTTNSGWKDIDLDLSAVAAADSQIRLLGSGVGVESELSVDNVRVATGGTVTTPGSPPPNLLSSVSLWPGESLVIEFLVVVDDPTAETQLINTATVRSSQFLIGASAEVVDFVDRPPFFVSAPADLSGSEGDVVAFTVSAQDPEAFPVTFSASGLPPGIGIDPSSGVISGVISYSASPGSPYTATVTVTDIAGLTASATFQWSVADTNRAPTVGNPGSLAVAEGDPVTLAISGTDPDGDALSWSATGLPDGLAIAPTTGVVSGTVSYVAAASSPYTVTIRATDDGTPVLFIEVSFSWTVTDTNRAPIVANPGDTTTAEGATVSMPVSGSDPDGDTLQWSVSGLPAGMSIDPATGVVSGSFDYDAAASSPYAVTIRATDDGTPVLFSEVSFSWTVTNTNRAPAITSPGSQTVAEGQAVSLAVSGSDPDGDTLQWSVSGLPAGMSIDPATGVVSGSFDYDAAASSPYAVTIRATDDGTPVLFSEVSFSWTVTNTNRAPAITSPGSQTVAEGQAVSLAVSGSDPDGDTLQWSATGLPASLVIDPATGTITGTVGFTSSGIVSVTVRATDSGTPRLSSEVSFSWTVTDTNRAPTVQTPTDRTNEEGDVIALQVIASDPDGDALSFAAVGLPAGLTINRVSGSITGSLGYSLDGSYTVTVTVTDDGNPALSSRATFVWVIADTNRQPTVTTPGSHTSEVGESVSFSATATDPDGDGLAWSATGLPPGVTISPTTGQISGAATAPGSFTVTVTVTDNGIPPTSTSVSFVWTILSPPGFPVVETVPAQWNLVGDRVSLGIDGSHPDGLAITYSASGLPQGLTIDPSTGRITGTTSTAGTSFVVVTVTDTRGQETTVAFAWTVEVPVDEPPVVSDDEVSLSTDTIPAGGVVLDAIGNDHDPEGEALTIVSAGPAETGTVTIVDGYVVFMPPSGWMGTVTFPYTVRDPAGNQASGFITVTIEESLATRLGTQVLATDPGELRSVSLTDLGRLDPSAGTEVLLGTVFQSLYVLRFPLALLGGAVFWSLLLGGLLNLGFVLRGGIPRFVRRHSRSMAVVLAPHGGKVEVLEEPGRGAVVGRLSATERGVETGRRVDEGGEQWVEVTRGDQRGWVPAFNLTEEVDRSWFADDPEPPGMVKEFVSRLRARQDFSDLVSRHGLFVSHHAPLIHFPAEAVSRVMEDSVAHIWKGRNPAYPDFAGSFDMAVATGVLDAFDHPRRELLPDTPALPSTVVPVEFTNLHFIAIGADVHGPERLDQSAWLVVFSYEDARPKIIGLVKEG